MSRFRNILGKSTRQGFGATFREDPNVDQYPATCNVIVRVGWTLTAMHSRTP